MEPTGGGQKGKNTYSWKINNGGVGSGTKDRK